MYSRERVRSKDGSERSLLRCEGTEKIWHYIMSYVGTPHTQGLMLGHGVEMSRQHGRARRAALLRLDL